MIARVLAFDGAIGSQLSEVIEGVYTGTPVGLFIYRAGKAEAIAKLAREEGFDLTESYAYSDSESDLPMFRVVGHPVAVNPDAELAQIARESDWEVLRFDRLGRRLKAGVALVAATAAGGIGSAALASRGQQSSLRGLIRAVRRRARRRSGLKLRRRVHR